MGVCFSSSTSKIKNVRVVHVNGKVNEFEPPVTASQATGKAGEYVLCTPAQLLSVGVKPLRPTAQLDGGCIYIMLPHSTFLSQDVSPVDMASMVRKLTAAAKNSGRCSGNAKSPEQRPQQRPQQAVMRPWRPVLDTIREMSFNRMSESNLQEHGDQLEADSS